MRRIDLLRIRHAARQHRPQSEHDLLGDVEPIPYAALQSMPEVIARHRAALAGVEPIPERTWERNNFDALAGLDGIGSKFKKAAKKVTKNVVKPVQHVVKQAVPKPILKLAKKPLAQLGVAAVLPVAALPGLLDKDFRRVTAPIYAGYAAGGLTAAGAAAAASAPLVQGAITTAGDAGGGGGGGGGDEPTGYLDDQGELAFEQMEQVEAEAAPAAEPTTSPLKPLLGVGAVLAALSFLH